MYYLFRVELTLSKVEDQVWPQVVVGDNRGEMTMDPAVVAQIHERLAALTSDQMVRARVLSVVLQYHTLLIHYFFQSILHILDTCSTCIGFILLCTYFTVYAVSSFVYAYGNLQVFYLLCTCTLLYMSIYN